MYTRNTAMGVVIDTVGIRSKAGLDRVVAKEEPRVALEVPGKYKASMSLSLKENSIKDSDNVVFENTIFCM